MTLWALHYAFLAGRRRGGRRAYPPAGAEKDSSKKRRGPGEDHPWKKKPFKRQK